MADADIQQIKIIKQFEPVRGLEVTVWESVVQPREICVVVLGGPTGWADVAQIDSSDPGATARALSLADIVHDVLQSAEMAWFDQ